MLSVSGNVQRAQWVCNFFPRGNRDRVSDPYQYGWWRVDRQLGELKSEYRTLHNLRSHRLRRRLFPQLL